MVSAQQKGFTLLELMIALAIFATLAAAVSHASQLVLRQNLRAQDRLLAAWAMDNHLQQRRLQGAARPGQMQYEVNLGGRRWQLFEVIEAAEPGLMQVDLALRWPGSSEVIHSLVSRLPVAYD